jgi:hypothetical protein
MALGNLKTLKPSDAVVDQRMTAANTIEAEGTLMAPSSAASVAGAGMIASVKSQGTMQRMSAPAIRQEAARVAHDKTAPLRARPCLLVVRAVSGDLEAAVISKSVIPLPPVKSPNE